MTAIVRNRRILPDLDKLLHAGLCRLCDEYLKLAQSPTELSIESVERLAKLSKDIMAIRKDPSIKDIAEINKATNKKQTPAELMADVLSGNDDNADSDYPRTDSQ